MKFPSKLSVVVAIIILSIIGGSFIIKIIEQDYITATVFIIITGLIYWLYRATYYTIVNDRLIVKSGFFINDNIDINTIIKVKETYNPMSAPAFSLDRLEISYGKSSSVLISPKNKTVFLEHLKSINNNIEFVYRK